MTTTTIEKTVHSLTETEFYNLIKKMGLAPESYGIKFGVALAIRYTGTNTYFDFTITKQ
jgi:hypothetical protein